LILCVSAIIKINKEISKIDKELKKASGEKERERERERERARKNCTGKIGNIDERLPSGLYPILGIAYFSNVYRNIEIILPSESDRTIECERVKKVQMR
jgi:hypothetical protein